MQNFNRTMTVTCSPERALEILTSATFENDKNLKANGSLESEVEFTKQDDSHCEYTSTTTDYERGITGVNKKKTEKTRYFYKWDLKKRCATWSMEHPMGKKILVSGTITLTGSGETTTIANSMAIEIKIPLVGRKIEKEIVKEIEKGWSKYEEVVREHVAK